MARRKFGGKYYKESMVRYSKRDAQETARRIRSRGALARITKEGKFWMVWERGG